MCAHCCTHGSGHKNFDDSVWRERDTTLCEYTRTSWLLLWVSPSRFCTFGVGGQRVCVCGRTRGPRPDLTRDPTARTTDSSLPRFHATTIRAFWTWTFRRDETRSLSSRDDRTVTYPIIIIWSGWWKSFAFRSLVVENRGDLWNAWRRRRSCYTKYYSVVVYINRLFDPKIVYLRYLLLIWDFCY